VIEAPDLVLALPRYFLFYSGNDWNSASYAIGVAVCQGPLGPCTASGPKPFCPPDRTCRDREGSRSSPAAMVLQ
jgi:hypothetical protein